ncbi:MAG: hyaluronan synthase [Thermoleophilaceae bacterium]|nr:hyaluronan synthase [Thermoleophilaceae bacterium]
MASISVVSDEALDPGSRALLDLTLRHGMSDEQLAHTLAVDAGDIALRRERAIEAVLAQAGIQAAPGLDPSEEVAKAGAAVAVADRFLAESRAARELSAERAAPARHQANKLDLFLRFVAAGYLAALLAAVVIYKAAFIEMITTDPLLTVYGLVVCGYIVTRFLFSTIYRSPRDAGLEPRVAIVMPGFNEEDAIGRSLRSLLEVDYPAEKLEIVAVDDGSTDQTLAAMRAVAAEEPRVEVIAFPENRGKRAAMAAGIRSTSAEIVAFVDSDSVLEPDALRRLVQGFADRKVGAMCGHANVLNLRESWLTRMQAVRYFVAFRVSKAAESIFGTVTCCSGCFSAYRREAILPKLEWWENQRFLGMQSTFGDDRSLTNCVLRGWKVRYDAKAVSHTAVPATFRQFMRQQLRWKRSWTRESLIVSRFVWRKNPLAALSTYVGILLPLVAPVICVHTVLWQPIFGDGGAPLVYALGVYSMAVAYGLYYAIRHPRYDDLWIYGVAFCFFYLFFLLWQTYFAILTARTTTWGTRPATAGSTEAAA